MSSPEVVTGIDRGEHFNPSALQAAQWTTRRLIAANLRYVRDLPQGPMMVEEGVAHAALVYVDGLAVAWAEYGTPEELPNIHHRKEYDETQGSPPDFRITCLFVDRDHRRASTTDRLAGRRPG